MVVVDVEVGDLLFLGRHFPYRDVVHSPGTFVQPDPLPKTTHLGQFSLHTRYCVEEGCGLGDPIGRVEEVSQRY